MLPPRCARRGASPCQRLPVPSIVRPLRTPFLPWHLAPLVAALSACGGDASSSSTPESEATGSPSQSAAQKGGLDGPAVAVGPFLDGALPPRTPNAQSGSDWTIENAFPNLSFGTTIAMASNPGDDRLYVGSQEGRIVAFENDPAASAATTFLDLTDRVAVVFEGGFLGMAFHPDFGQAGSPQSRSFYVYYSSHCPLDASGDAPDLTACDDGYPRDGQDGFNGVYLRLSRFEVPDGSQSADRASEQVLLNFELDGPVHRGGGLAIDRDGHLYLSIGDQGDGRSAQDTSDNFDGSALRIAVNVVDGGAGTWTCPPGSHQPRRVLGGGEVSGRYYCIPNDNPWLDSGGSLLEELCAIGLRNPFRLSVDMETQRVWVGDVGSSRHEEVNVIECGNNYGWPFREGFGSGPRSEPSSFLGVLTEPVVEFSRSEARSITGGYVYRGSRLPELYGLYIVGDFIENTIWSVTLDEATMSGDKTVLTSYPPGNLVTFAQDNDGEIFFTDIYSSGSIYELDRDGAPQPDAPARLSSIGAFSSMASATPSPFWVPYAPNQPFWSDGASKSRFIALPNDGTRNSASEQVGFSESGNWSFPIGTVLMKHFELPLDEADPSVTTRLETRFMVLGDDDRWYGLTYRWRADQLEADLLAAEETGDYTVDLAGGGSRNQTWVFPSRQDCLSCHRDGAGGVLGLSTHQLNGDLTYSSTGRTDNQLVTWNDLGMFSPTLSTGSVSSFPKAPSLDDVAAPLRDRARSWLDSNCGYCHQPGEVDAGFDLRFTTPFADQDLLWTPVRDDLGDPDTVVIYPGDPSRSAIWLRTAAVGNIAMPPFAKELADDAAVELLADWIERLPESEPNAAPLLASPGNRSTAVGQAVSLSLVGSDLDGDQLFFDAKGLPEGLSLNHDNGRITGTPVATGSNTVTASASDGPAVAVVTFSWQVVANTCGNGTVDASEECDDGNVLDGDGCSSSCFLEIPGFCGDGALDPGEQCDDGNTLSNDGCSAACALERCGDGVVNNGGLEQCEPPNTATCTNACSFRAPLCGDGFLTPPEACDDGNLTDGDGCSSTCTVEPPGACGDGVVDAGEQCDDGNLVSGDGCAADCSFEGVVDLTQTGTIVGRMLGPTGGGNKDPEVIRDGDKPPVGTRDSSRQFDTVSAERSSEDWIGYVYSTEQSFGQVVFQEGMHFSDGGYFLDLTVQVRRSGAWTEAPNVTITPAYAGDDSVDFNTYVFDFDPVSGDGIRIYGTPGGSKEFISVGELEVFGGSSETGPRCGDGILDDGEACDDGNANEVDGCNTLCRVEIRQDFTDAGIVIARVTEPTGSGSRDIEVIRDGDWPPVGTSSTSRQYDTYSDSQPASKDWIGYEFLGSQQVFARLVFQEGLESSAGGYFEDPTVQVRIDGVWTEVENLRVSPAYEAPDGVGYQIYIFDFDPVSADAIRLYGTPGGTASFVSVAELHVLGPVPSSGCRVSRGGAPFDAWLVVGWLGWVFVFRRRRRAC